MAKKPTAAQLAARKKFVAAVRAGKFRKGKKKPARKRKVVRKKTARRKSAPRKRAAPVRRSAVTVPGLKAKIRAKLDDQLKDQLFKRDKATNYKQHRTAQVKIDTIRRELRKLS